MPSPPANGKTLDDENASMKDLDRDALDLGSGDIRATFRRILFPTLLGMLASSVFGITDGIFVGRGVGSDGLAAVNIVMPIFTLGTAFGLMFGTGTSVVAAIHLSQQNVKAARIVTTQSFLAVLTIGVLLAVGFYAFAEQILTLLGASDALRPLCRDYYLWFVPYTLFIMVQIVAQFVIRLDGDPRYASLLEIIPACINIFLDWLFVFPLHKGLMGAAFATSIGGSIGVAMGAWYMLRHPRTLVLYRLKRTLTSLRLSLRNVGYVMRVGFSGFLGEFSYSILTLVGNYVFLRCLGEDGVASYSVASYITPVVFMIITSISQSAQPLMSYNYGADNALRVRRTFRLALVTSVSVATVSALLFHFFADAVVSVFLSPTSSAFPLCRDGFALFVFSLPPMALSLTAISYFQSVKRTRTANFLTLLRSLLLPVPAFLLLPLWSQTRGPWLASPLSECLVITVVGIYALAGAFRKLPPTP